jgi:arylsulfatase A-like enzyme/thioredoxin-like negative regulator of GroEL
MWWLTQLACSPPLPPPPIVLVTLDTTRADRIGAYGYSRGSTPNLDKLAGEGVRFDAAYTTVPLTSAAHASLLSGLYPSKTGVRANGDSTLPDEVGTLAEYLHGAGYSTMATVGAFVTTSLWNFDQGFDTYHDTMTLFAPNRWGLQRPAQDVVLDLENYLRKVPKDKPAFIWIHLYDPHLPWEAPGIWQNKGADAYDSEIAFADGQLGRARTFLEKALGPRIAWVVVSDHGEGLEGDFEEGHGMYLRQETVRVPFLLRPADPLAEPIVVSESVSLVDVAPTILALAGAELPPGLDGIDLSHVLEGETLTREPVVVESELPRVRLGWAPEVAVIDENLKLYDTPDPRLYDLSQDPKEEHNLLGERAADVDRLRKVGQAVRQQTPMGAGHDLGGLAAQLEALGYTTAEASDTSANVDAKTRADVVRSLDDARAAKEGRLRGVDPKAVWRELLARDPSLTEARLSLVLAAYRAGDRELAMSLVEEGLALSPDSISLRLDRGRLLLAQGQLEEAAREAEAILAREPTHRSARDLLISTLPPAQALERIQKWQQETPSDAFLHARAGQMLLVLGRVEEAEPALRLALEAPVPWIGVHQAMAVIEARAGRVPAALQHLSTEVSLFPESISGWLALGKATLENQDAKTAAEAYERALRLAPGEQAARLGLIEALLRLGDGAGASKALEPLMPSDDPRLLALAQQVQHTLENPAPPPPAPRPTHP